MRQKKIEGYRPNYPKKGIKTAVFSMSALMTVTASVACTPKNLQTTGIVPAETPPEEELVLDGEVGYELPEDDPLLGGEPLPDESDEESGGCTGDEPVLMGKIAVPEDRS